MGKKALIIIAFTGLFVVAALSSNSDVTGEWELTMQTPRGEWAQTVEFVQDGEKLTVTMEGRQGGEIEGTGTIVDNKIEWTIIRNTQRGDFEMTYSGTADGDEMTGTVQMGQRGEMEWTAVRKS